MKLTICVFLAFACLALTYAYPAEELVVDVAQDDVAPVFDDTDGLEDVAGDALVREKRQHHHHHHGTCWNEFEIIGRQLKRFLFQLWIIYLKLFE